MPLQITIGTVGVAGSTRERYLMLPECLNIVTFNGFSSSISRYKVTDTARDSPNQMQNLHPSSARACSSVEALHTLLSLSYTPWRFGHSALSPSTGEADFEGLCSN